MQSALGAGMVLDLERVFFAAGNSCAVGSRFQVSCAQGWMAMQVPPRLARTSDLKCSRPRKNEQQHLGRVRLVRIENSRRLACWHNTFWPCCSSMACFCIPSTASCCTGPPRWGTQAALRVGQGRWREPADQMTAVEATPVGTTSA